jgi:hypothetical protein
MDSGCKWIQDIKKMVHDDRNLRANEDLQQFNLYTHNIYDAIPNKKIIRKNKPELGLQVKPSLSTGKKIDVYDGKKVASVGDLKV